MDPIDANVLDKLRQFDTPTISNVIELFAVRPRTSGFTDNRIQACFPEMPPMVGFAATATCRTAIDLRDSAYTSLPDQVARFEELSGPPVVVFQDLDDPPLAATFGEIMCTTYKTFGAAGLITNGGGRDLDQVRALAFPVFTDRAVCSHGYIRILDTHQPVRVGGLVIFPDDLLHGDINGIISVPKHIAADVADVAAEFVAAEQVILQALRSDSPTLSTLRQASAESKAMIESLQQRIIRR